MKLELGAGLRPTRGYTHNDTQPFPHIELVNDAWMLDLPTDSVDEVFAVAFIEHLTFDQACDTFRNVARMLRPGGVFLFDVPDYPKWVQYYQTRLIGGEVRPEDSVPPMDHVRRTLFGWGRWPGDEHKYGWDLGHLGDTLLDIGFQPGKNLFDGLPMFKARTYRRRFDEPWNAHLYVCAIK